MEQMQRDNKLRRFQVLCNKPEMFAITAGLILTAKGLDKGVDALIEEDRWYAQIADCIIKGDVSTVTDDERVAFIDLHVKMLDNAEQR